MILFSQRIFSFASEMYENKDNKIKEQDQIGWEEIAYNLFLCRMQCRLTQP